MVKFEVYSAPNNQMFDLVSATVAVITTRALQVIDVVRAAVPYLNVGGLPTTAWSVAKADLPGYSTVGDCRMSTI